MRILIPLLMLPSIALAAMLTWKPSPSAGVEGYNLHYGKTSGNYTDSADAGEATTYDLDLPPGTWYIAATAYENGNESDYSNEVKAIIPEIVRPKMDIPKTHWQVVYFDSQEIVGEPGQAIHAIDGDPNTLWHTQWENTKPPQPHEIQIDLGGWYVVEGFSYLPRQDGGENGTIADYEFYVSGSKTNFGLPVAVGSFAATTDLGLVDLNTPVIGRYIRLKSLSEINGRDYTSVAEIGVTGRLLFQCR